MNGSIAIMKKRLLVLLFIVILLVAAYWISSHAYIEVSVEGSGGDTTYALLAQDGRETTEIRTSASTIKRLVRKGNYEILVRRDGESYFTVVKAGGFLKKTAIAARLEKEKARRFIGNNPAPCAHYTGDILFSFTCHGPTGSLQAHVPATSDRPTFIRKSTEFVEGNIESIVRFGNNSVLIVREPEQTAAETSGGAHYIAFPLREDLELGSGRALPDLSNESARYYTAKPHGQGFIVYDDSFERVLYYDSIAAKPSELTLAGPDDTTLQPYTLSTNGESITVAYSVGIDDAALEESEAAKQKSEVVVTGDDNPRKFRFNKRYSSVLLCGQGKLCALFGNQVEVFDISSTEAELLYAVGGVDAMEASDKDILLVREKEVFAFNVDERAGFTHYNLGDYNSCGIQADAGGYVLCLINRDQEKVAIHVAKDQPDTDSIDKKISELLKLPAIKSISAYGSFIYVSPELGEVVFDESAGEYGYPEARRRQAADAIDRGVDSLGIDRNKYTIINTFE